MAYAKFVHEWDGSDAVTAFEVGGDLEDLDACVVKLMQLWRGSVEGESVEGEPTP